MENVQIKITKKEYNRSQTSLLIRSMLIAGVAFILLGLASFGFSVMFNTYGTGLDVGLAICLSTLFGGMIISMLWVYNMFKSGSWPLTIICYILYIALTSVAFGWIFSLGFNAQLEWLPIIFVAAGAVFALATLIAKIMSVNGVVTMGKIIGATAIAMGIIMIVFLIMMIVFMTTINPGVGLATDALCSLLIVGMCLISFLYIIIDLWQIQKISQFNQDMGVEESKILPWLFGYRLLTDLVNLVFIILIFVLRFARRN